MTLSTLSKPAVLLLAALFLLSGCASSPPSQQASAPVRPQAAALPAATAPKAPEIYPGAGQDESLLKAMNMAKMDAVRKAVIDMIGAAAETANQAKLGQVLYGTSNPNAFVDNASMKETRKDKVGEKFVYEISILVNKPAVEAVLKSNGLLGPVQPASPAGQAMAAVQPAPVQPAAAQPAAVVEDKAPPVETTPEERNFIRKYLDAMTYMVYFKEDAKEDQFLMKGAVGMANSFLVSNSRNAIDFEQVEKLKKDQRKAYEEETGKEISEIQWIAQKLNADVYIVIDAVTEGETRDGNHYGSAKITLTMFEASTGNLLGSVPYASPRTFSKVSQFDAKSNAIQSTIYKAMPVAVDQSKALMGKGYERGIKYELIIQKTSDQRLMTRFRTNLRRKVKDLQVVFQSPDETKYAVYLFGRLEQLEEIVYDVSAATPGLDKLEQVMFRGKTITFTTGL